MECRCLRHVVSSAAEAETAGLFHNAQNIISIRRILEALGHPQNPTPLKTDNETSYGFIKNNIHQRKSKTWDMRFYWLRDNETKKNIKVYWKKGKDTADPNLADYPTKHHCTIHHKGIRSHYVLDKIINHIYTLNHTSQVLRGCVDPHRNQHIPDGTQIQSCDVV